MDKNKEEKKDRVVVRNDTGEKISGPMSESDAQKIVHGKTVKEGKGALAIKQIIHG